MLVYDLKRSLLLDSSPDSPLSVYVPHAWHPSDSFREFFHFIIVVLFFWRGVLFRRVPGAVLFEEIGLSERRRLRPAFRIFVAFHTFGHCFALHHYYCVMLSVKRGV